MHHTRKTHTDWAALILSDYKFLKGIPNSGSLGFGRARMHYLMCI